MKRILLAFICTQFQLCTCKNAHFMAISLVQKKNIFSQKTENMCIGKALVNQINMNQLHGEVAIFLSNLYPRLSSTHAWFLHTLWAHKLMSKKTMTTFVEFVPFEKKPYSISKGRLMSITHTVQIQEKPLFLNLPKQKSVFYNIFKT